MTEPTPPLPSEESPEEEVAEGPEVYWESAPHLLIETIRRRNIVKKKNFMCSVTGDPGSKKSYGSLFWAEQYEKRYYGSTFPFDPEIQIVWSPDTFWDAVYNLPQNEWHMIVYDDPSGEYSNQSWATPVAKIVTSFVQTSARYRKKNILFPTITTDILPKGARRVIGYEMMMTIPKEPVGRLHRCKPNRYGNSPEVWKDFLFEARCRIPKCAEIYEKRRDEWSKKFFTRDKFVEGGRIKHVDTEIKETLVDKTYKLVTDGKDVLGNTVSYLDPKKKRITPNMIIGGAHVSRKVADEVLSRLQFEKMRKEAA